MISQHLFRCRQATCHYPNKCWPSSMTPYGITGHNALMVHWNTVAIVSSSTNRVLSLWHAHKTVLIYPRSYMGKTFTLRFWFQTQTFQWIESRRRLLIAEASAIMEIIEFTVFIRCKFIMNYYLISSKLFHNIDIFAISHFDGFEPGDRVLYDSL